MPETAVDQNDGSISRKNDVRSFRQIGVVEPESETKSMQGFSEAAYRSDDGGATWRATYFQDPRFQNCNVTPNWETASCGQCFKGGETPFGVAICNTDPRL